MKPSNQPVNFARRLSGQFSAEPEVRGAWRLALRAWFLGPSPERSALSTSHGERGALARSGKRASEVASALSYRRCSKLGVISVSVI
jgi:hypothetical protein